jgi:hypothetical protein
MHRPNTLSFISTRWLALASNFTDLVIYIAHIFTKTTGLSLPNVLHSATDTVLTSPLDVA